MESHSGFFLAGGISGEFHMMTPHDPAMETDWLSIGANPCVWREDDEWKFGKFV